jgi:hypothetical protein
MFEAGDAADPPPRVHDLDRVVAERRDDQDTALAVPAVVVDAPVDPGGAGA